MIRTFYPYRRLERDWGISTDCAHHIELPSLPWGVPTISGRLRIPESHAAIPRLRLHVRELARASHLLARGTRRQPRARRAGPVGIVPGQLHTRCGDSERHRPRSPRNGCPITQQLGDAYPLACRVGLWNAWRHQPSSRATRRAGLPKASAATTRSATQQRRLVNATYPQFWQAVDQADPPARHCPSVRAASGMLGISGRCRSRSMPRRSREGERSFLAAETCWPSPNQRARGLDRRCATGNRQRAEWCWAMLSDHAWNGTGEENQRHNAQLRRQWSDRTAASSRTSTLEQAWSAAGVRAQRPACDRAQQPQHSAPRSGARACRRAGMRDAVCDGQHTPATSWFAKRTRTGCTSSLPRLTDSRVARASLAAASDADVRQPLDRWTTATIPIESPYYRLAD